MIRGLSKVSCARTLQVTKLSSRRYISSSVVPSGRLAFVKTRYILSAGAILSGLLAFKFESLGNDSSSAEDFTKSVEVDKSVSPFSTVLGPPNYLVSTNYSLLGFGARAVTFLNFKVYALGIYVANEDLSLIPQILSSNYLSKAFLDTDGSRTHSQNVSIALKDPVKSRILVGNLIDGGVRMLAKITPIRNTDFNHLKEGLIKSILNHPDAKKNQELVSRGIQELKDAFTRKGSVPKNDDLLIELQVNGSLQLSYRSRKTNEVLMLGKIDEPLIGRLLFSQYLSGAKPLSPATRDSFITKVEALVQ